MEYQVDAAQKIQETIVVPAHKEYPSVRYDFKDPFKEGEKIEIIIRKDGVDLDILSYVQGAAIAEGNEVRAYVQLAMAEMVSFTEQMVAPRVLSSSGVVSEKIAD